MGEWEFVPYRISVAWVTPERWFQWQQEQNHVAFSIPFATLPTNLFIRGPRYRLSLGRYYTT